MSDENFPSFDSTMTGHNAFVPVFPVEQYEELRDVEEAPVKQVAPVEALIPPAMAEASEELSEAADGDAIAIKRQAMRERRRRRDGRRRRALRASSGPRVRMF